MLFVAVWAVAAVHAPAAAPPPFVSAAFEDPPEPSVLEIRGPLATNVASILGHVYPHPRVDYWLAGGKTVWILEGRGRSGRFTAGFVLDGGRIAASDVLVYAGDRGREIRSRSFLRQFNGVALRENRELDRKIDGITGATISVDAMENLVRLALCLDYHVRRGGNDPGGRDFRPKKGGHPPDAARGPHSRRDANDRENIRTRPVSPVAGEGERMVQLRHGCSWQQGSDGFAGGTCAHGRVCLRLGRDGM